MRVTHQKTSKPVTKAYWETTKGDQWPGWKKKTTSTSQADYSLIVTEFDTDVKTGDCRQKAVQRCHDKAKTDLPMTLHLNQMWLSLFSVKCRSRLWMWAVIMMVSNWNSMQTNCRDRFEESNRNHQGRDRRGKSERNTGKRRPIRWARPASVLWMWKRHQPGKQGYHRRYAWSGWYEAHH